MGLASSSSTSVGLAPLLLPKLARKEAHSPPSYLDHERSPRVGEPFTRQQEGTQWSGQYLYAHGDHRSSGLAVDADGHREVDQESNDGLTPYLGLRSRMFLSMFSAPLVALIFTATHLLISSSSIKNSVATAKERLLDVCQAAEKEASTVASLPHWMADSMNQRTSQMVESTVHGAGTVLSLSITAVENLLVFLADTYRSLFQCFIELLVRASLALLMAAVALLNSAVREAAAAIEATIQASVNGINAFLSTTISGINDLLSVVGRTITIPTIAQPDLSALDNVELPPSFQEALLRLNSTLPTLTALRQQMDALISGPFVEVKREIQNTTSNFTFNSSLLPAPAPQTITFCDEIDLSSLDDFAHALQKLLYIILGVLGGAVLICIAFQLFKAWYSWRCLNRHLERVQAAWQDIDPRMTKEGASSMRDGSPLSSFLSKSHLFTLLSLSQHPLLSSISFKAGDKLGMKSVRAQNHLRWWLAFVSHPMAIAILALGLTGLIATQVQLWSLAPVQERYQSSFDLSFAMFANDAVARVNNVTMAASEEYANRTNILILAAQEDLNDHLFSWVNTTTSTMNNSVNALQSGLSDAMNSTFTGTPLYDSIQNFLRCVIFSKLEKIEEALTWISDNAVVNFTLVPPDVLALSANQSQELAKAITGGSGSDSGAAAVFSRVTQEYRERLELERLMFAILLVLYGLLVLVGSVVALFGGQSDPQESFLARVLPTWLGGGRCRRSVYASRVGGGVDSREKRDVSDGENVLAGGSHDSITAPMSVDTAMMGRDDLSGDQYHNRSQKER